MKDFRAFIPFVNRPDLLHRAVLSCKDIWEDLMIIHNSDVQLTVTGMQNYRPIVPLSFSQTMNCILKMTKNTGPGRNICLFMHSDAEAAPGVCLNLLEEARRLTAEKKRWGVLWTAYDALAAFNVEAFDDIGGWDTNIPWYASDDDAYHRLRLAGWDCIDTGLEVKHEPSQTIKSDANLNFINSITFPLTLKYYEEKWGGRPGDEKFLTPFDRG